MANYVKQTWTDGVSSASAARLGVIEDGIYDAHFQPAAHVYHSANQSITSSTLTALAFNSERFDTDTIHDNSTNNSRLTCKTAGKYQIAANVTFDVGTTGYRELLLRLNAATLIGYVSQNPASTVGTAMYLATIYDLAVNDYVEALVNHTQGSALNITAGANYSPEFMMFRVA